MKLIHHILLILAVIPYQSFAQEFKAFSNDSSSVLWRIESRNGNTAHIFGTMHLMTEENFFFPDTVTSLVKGSDVLVMELGGEIFDPSIMSLLMIEDGELSDFFTNEQMDSVYTFASEKMMIDEELFQMSLGKMKPFVVAQIFAMAKGESDTTDKDSIRSHELEFKQIADKDSIEILGLETAKEQIQIFDDLPANVQSEMVMDEIREKGEAEEKLNDLVKMYKSQNIDSMYIFIHDGDSYFSVYEDEFLSIRNHNWIPKMEEIMEDNKAFFAVGAGHLGGPEGIIRLLRKEGYTVTPIRL